MKYLHEFISAAEGSERIERKFIMSQGQSSNAVSILIGLGFYEKYVYRCVNSIYFDDIDHSCLRDNIDGVASRDKLRVRYYDDAFNKAKIEIKHRRNNFGYKSTFSLQSDIQSEKDVLQEAKNWCSKNVLNVVFPSAHVRYKRKYYERGMLRATVDTAVNSGRLIGSQVLTSAMLNYEVIEFKYPTSMDSEFRRFYKYLDKIALRNTKSSKYSNALMY